MKSLEFKVVPTESKVSEKSAEESFKLNEPEDIVKFWYDEIIKSSWFSPMKECMVVVPLATNLEAIGYNLVSLGSLNETIASPREIFIPVIMSHASSFVMIHNHPSGHTDPSEADRKVTRRIKEGSEILQISLLDHLIVSSKPNVKNYFSFQEHGFL